MKYALISPNEKVVVISAWEESADGYVPTYLEVGDRVAHVSGAKFDVAQPLFWVECPDEVTAEQYCYKDATFAAIPSDEDCPPQPTLEQPISQGAQTL